MTHVTQVTCVTPEEAVDAFKEVPSMPEKSLHIFRTKCKNFGNQPNVKSFPHFSGLLNKIKDEKTLLIGNLFVSVLMQPRYRKFRSS